MKLAYALASSALLSVGSAIDTKRIKRKLRHLESAKNSERLLGDEIAIGSMSMSMAAVSESEGIEGMFGVGGHAKSSKKESASKSSKKAKSSKKVPVEVMDFFFVGHEECVDSNFERYDSISYNITVDEEDEEDECKAKCSGFADTGSLIGFEYTSAANKCYCLFEDGHLDPDSCPEGAAKCNTSPEGTGPMAGTEIGSVLLKGGPLCYRYGAPGLHPSSFTNFNEDGALCNDAKNNLYDGILFRTMTPMNFVNEDYPSVDFDSPYDVDSPKKCALQCAKAGFVNLVGFNYISAFTRGDPPSSRGGNCTMEMECAYGQFCDYDRDPNPICENCPGGIPNNILQEACELVLESEEAKAECLKCPEVEPPELFEVKEDLCRCLVPEGAADCSGYDGGNWDACSDGTDGSSGNGTGPIMFATDKEYFIEENEIFGSYLEFIDFACIRNDNFDPNKPTLGANFPNATAPTKSAKSAKSAKSTKKGFMGKLMLF